MKLALLLLTCLVGLSYQQRFGYPLGYGLNPGAFYRNPWYYPFYQVNFILECKSIYLSMQTCHYNINSWMNEWIKTVSIWIVALEMITEPGQRFRGAGRWWRYEHRLQHWGQDLGTIAVATWTAPVRFEPVTEPDSFEHPNCDVGHLYDGDCTSHRRQLGDLHPPQSVSFISKSRHPLPS